jgi:hypothetical protein
LTHHEGDTVAGASSRRRASPEPAVGPGVGTQLVLLVHRFERLHP